MSRSGNIIPFHFIPFCIFDVYLIHFLCCFTRSNDKLYIWLTPSPLIFGCLNMYICYFVIFDIYYNNISLLNATDIYLMNYRLIIYMLSFSHLSLHFNRKIGTVVVVICFPTYSNVTRRLVFIINNLYRVTMV